jgi:hypothetical protein
VRNAWQFQAVWDERDSAYRGAHGCVGVSQSDRGVRRGRVDVAVERLGPLASIGRSREERCG